MKMVYLASPYSHEDEEVREARYEAACKACLRLFLEGYAVFSPIVHWHNITKTYRLKTDHKTFEEYNKEILQRADEVVFFVIPGFVKSKGIAAELAWASSCQKPMRFYELED